MGAAFSKVIGSVAKKSSSASKKAATAAQNTALKNNSPKSKGTFNDVGGKSDSAAPKTNLERADDLIVQQSVKKYEPLMTKDPITGDPTRKSYVAKAEQIEKGKIKEARKFKNYYNDENAQYFKTEKGSPKPTIDSFKKSDPDTADEILDNTKEIRDAKGKITQSKANLAQAKAAQGEVREEAASTIQQHWRNRKPTTPAQRQQIRDDYRAVEAQSDQLAKTGTIGYDDKLRDGFTVNSNRLGGAFNQERLVVDRAKDAHLNKFLNSGGISGLKSGIPGKNATPVQEMEFLNRAKSTVNGKYSKVSPQESLKTYEKVGQFNHSHDVGGVKVSLGNTIEAGCGVCRHRSTASKVMFDNLGVKSSLNTGSVPLANGQRGDHAWNKVQMASGREYLFDPMHNKVKDLSNPAELEAYKKSYRTIGEDPA